MSKAIKTYADLLEEKQRLHAILFSQKQAVKNNISSIKQSLSPLHIGYKYASRFFSRGANNPFLNIITQIFTSFVLKQLIRRRIGWIKRRSLEIFIGNFFANTFRPIANIISYKVLQKIKPTNTLTAAKRQY